MFSGLEYFFGKTEKVDSIAETSLKKELGIDTEVKDNDVESKKWTRHVTVKNCLIATTVVIAVGGTLWYLGFINPSILGGGAGAIPGIVEQGALNNLPLPNMGQNQLPPGEVDLGPGACRQALAIQAAQAFLLAEQAAQEEILIAQLMPGQIIIDDVIIAQLTPEQLDFYQHALQSAGHHKAGFFKAGVNIPEGASSLTVNHLERAFQFCIDQENAKQIRANATYIQERVDYLRVCYNYNPEMFVSNVNMLFVLQVIQYTICTTIPLPMSEIVEFLVKIYTEAVDSPATVDPALIMEILHL